MTAVTTTRERFERAVEAFVGRVKEDRHLLAVILFGSLSYDTVWDRSDIDLLLVCEDKTVPHGGVGDDQFFALTEDGVVIHAFMQPRAEYKRMMQGTLQGSFIHSSVAKSRLLFTRDESLRELHENLHRIGSRDREAQLFHAAVGALSPLTKAEKFLRVKNDPEYSFLWLIHSYGGLAQIECYLNDELPTREVLHQAIRHNPEFFGAVYTDLVNRKKTAKSVGAALKRIDDYLLGKKRLLFGPLLEYLRAEGVPRTVTEIDEHLSKTANIRGGSCACEWLADKGVLGKASGPVRLTTKSRVEFEELAFFPED